MNWIHVGEAHLRGRLVAAIFEGLEVKTAPSRVIAVVAVPRAGWKPFFPRVGNQLETRVSRAITAQRTQIPFNCRLSHVANIVTGTFPTRGVVQDDGSPGPMAESADPEILLSKIVALTLDLPIVSKLR